MWKYKGKGIDWRDELFSDFKKPSDVDPYVSQINRFKDIINRNIDPITDSDDGKLTLNVALSILESANKQKVIKI